MTNAGRATPPRRVGHGESLNSDIVPALEGMNRGLNGKPKRYTVIAVTSRQTTRSESSRVTGSTLSRR